MNFITFGIDNNVQKKNSNSYCSAVCTITTPHIVTYHAHPLLQHPEGGDAEGGEHRASITVPTNRRLCSHIIISPDHPNKHPEKEELTVPIPKKLPLQLLSATPDLSSPRCN